MLGAGGVAGQAYHLAVLASLRDAWGWDARDAAIVVGTSVGSLVGALIRAGASTDELIVEASGGPLEGPDGVLVDAGHAPDPPEATSLLGRPHVTLRELTARIRREPRVPPRTALGSLLPRGRCEAQRHADWVDEVVGARWPSDPLWVCATELPTLERVVWGRDGRSGPSIGTAVAASCAVPALLEPIAFDGHEYVDGGLYSTTNADVLAGRALDLVIVSAPMSVDGSSGGSASLDRLGRELLRRSVQREVAALRDEGTRIVTLQPRVEELAPLRASTLGRAAAGRAIEELREHLRHRLRSIETSDSGPVGE